MIKSVLHNFRIFLGKSILPEEFRMGNGQIERIWGYADNASGEAVTPLSSLRTVAVMRCVSLIAGVAASFPVDVIKRVGANRERQPDHLVERRLDWDPNPEMSAYDLRFAMWAHYLLWGNAYALKVTLGGRLIALWPLHPMHVQVKRDDETGSLLYAYSGGKESKVYSADQVLHIRNFTLDGINGLSVIRQSALAVGVNQVAEKSAAVMLKQGTRPTVVMEIPHSLDQKQRDEIRAAWAESNGGTDNTGKLAIAEAGSKLLPLSIPADDLQFLEQRQHSDEQVFMMFGVPPSMGGITTKSTSWGTGIESMKQGFLDITLAPGLKNHEQAYERCLLSPSERDISIKHNTGAYLRMDELKTMQAFAIAVKSRIRNPNECRALLDLNGYEGGDEFLAQMQDLPIEAALLNTPGGNDGPNSQSQN